MKPRVAVPPLVQYALLGLVGLALVVGVVLWLNLGSHVRLEGKILKVRLVATGEDTSVAVVEFRVNNPAKVAFVVRDVRMVLTDAEGTRVEAMMVSQPDLDRVLGYYPAEGPRYNEVLRARSKIAAGKQGDDWCAAGAYGLPAGKLAGRRNLELEIEDVDGAVIRIPEKPAQK
jgi:hypothetical protein